MFKNLFKTCLSNTVSNGQKVKVNNKWEAEYWSNRLHTTPDTLLQTIKKVGNSLNDIRKELDK